jgi:biotin synthase
MFELLGLVPKPPNFRQGSDKVDAPVYQMPKCFNPRKEDTTTTKSA